MMSVGAHMAMSGQAQALEPASPSILAGDLLYVSGQGAQDALGRVPREPAAQIRQCLSKVKGIVEAAGLTLEHVVYVQVYLTDYTDEGLLNQGWKEFFPKSPPARSTIGVASIGGTPVEMTAVAVKDLSRKKPIVTPGYPSSSPLSPAISVGNCLYLSGHLGRDINTGHIPQDPEAQVQLSLDRMRATLKLAGADFRNVVFMIPYFTDRVSPNVLNRVCAKNFDPANPAAWVPIHVAGLPSGANVEFTGVAVMDLTKRRTVRPKNMESSPTSSPCVLADNTLYCSAKAGFIPGIKGGINASSLEAQARQTMRNLLDDLAQANMSFANVVATHVYLDDIRDADRLDRVYAQYFTARAPARTLVQPATPTNRVPDARGRWPALEEISIIAVK
jgi:2-iminobutanoate/2-iminopropanoate deaminase